ncbi:LD-carboxypeptidase [Alkalimonas delamerensis]|uniref:LD-carboxypeptidase n=1 Tax=Alkalimonas delamerensis TaxID=265981 RepID=A0ABT9GT87_9GAMM|nr:LD-carboxypeptidase [Alkalimonas delamerensis]MDP4529990.1 LD-carboxypeptidase [Alkalimonas delamerensis]
MNKRNFLKLGLGSALLPLMTSTGQAASPPVSPAAMLAIALKPGDTVGIVSPSAAIASRQEADFAIESMQALGFRVKSGQHMRSRHGHLAGQDADRAADFNAMFADPEVKAVICLRGGSGAARILPLIDYRLVQNNPKVVLGYSDITAIHSALHAKTGLVTFHGPNGSSRWPDFNVQQFEQLFFKRQLLHYQNEQRSEDDLIVRSNRTSTIFGGKATGKLLGGNLTVLTSLVGTPYLPDFRNAILFVEDINEPPYKIDRMLSTLRLSGALAQIRGFIFGDCARCEPGGGWGSLTLDDILEDYLLPLQIPAYRGAMIGHIARQFIVPVGGQVELDADAGTFRLLQPVLQPA